MTVIYYTRWLLMPDQTVLENGAVSVASGVITSAGRRSKVRRSSSDRVVNLDDCLLMPGFINIHTHLEESVLRGFPQAPGETFAARFSKKNTRLKSLPEPDIRSGVRLAVRESLANGITTVVDHSRLGLSGQILPDESVRAWVVQEVHAETPEQESALCESIEQGLPADQGLVRRGIAPYALFSLTPTAHRRVIDAARKRGCLWAIHMAESAEELQAFSERSGDLFFMQTRRRPWPFGSTPLGPMHCALTANLVPNGGLCVHCNYVNGYELSLLAAKHVSVAICPQYNAALGHKSFALDIALKRGLCVCVGTESVAETESYNLFDELFRLKTAYPHIPAAEMVRWVTLNPARALGVSTALGSIEEGKAADIIGVRFRHDPEKDLLEELLVQECAVAFVMVNGEELIIDH